METKSICCDDTYPIFANGEITITGTRAPSPSVPLNGGGGTWSCQPPLSSHKTMMALLPHKFEFLTACTKLSSHSIPLAILPCPGCMLCPGDGCTHITAGTDPTESMPLNADIVKSCTFAKFAVV